MTIHGLRGAIMKKSVIGFAFAIALAHTAFADVSAKAQSPAPLFNWGSDPATQYWSVYVGGMYLSRSRPDSAQIITTNPGPATLLDANAFDFNWKTNPEFILQRRFDGGWTVEGRYFQTGTMSANNGVPGVTTFRLAGIGVTVLGGGDLTNTYDSRLRSAEFNVYKQLTSGFAVLAGYRSFRFDDHLHIGLVGTGLNLSDWNDSNRMNGGQIGASLTLMSPGIPLQFNATAKTGWYKNSMDNDLTSQVVSRNSTNLSKTSTATELDLTATYQLANNLALRAGYMMLWMNSLALAGEAPPHTTQVAGGTSSPVSTGNVLYQGATFGAVVTF